MKPATSKRFPQSLVPSFRLAVADITQNKYSSAGEHLLRLCLRHAMLVQALSAVAVVPIETDDQRNVDH